MADMPLAVPDARRSSPLPTAADIDRALLRAAARPRTLPGIDLREPEQLRLLDELLPFYSDLDLENSASPGRFDLANTWFTYADAVFLALMMRRFRPRRVIEVGSGFSTALMLDINERFLGNTVDISTIDPDPSRLSELLVGEDMESLLIDSVVQDVPLARFDSLRANDILCIDSSHVVKAGSDVQFLLDDVLPRLAGGVLIHFHDVFYPFEYPEYWLRDGVAMNEAYAVRTLLNSSSRYRIRLFTDFLLTFHHERLAATMPLTVRRPFPTGGIWLEVSH